MGWQPGQGNAAGEEPDPAPDRPAPERSGTSPAQSPAQDVPTAAGETARDSLLAGFAKDGMWDTCAPGPALADALAGAAGPEWRCPGATDDELTGVLRRLAALEAWTAAARLGVIREMIRRDGMPLPGRPRHGDLPDEWSDSLDHELALALASSVQSAQATALTAWELGARLPGTAALLAEGILSYSKARLIAETFQWLSDDDAARAEALLVPRLTGPAGKTFGQLVNLTARIAAQVDPGLAERRRKAAVRHASRVQMFREPSGAAALSGRDLPPDETLAANANVCARAAVYKDSGAFGDARMDQYRATAYLDLLNEVPAETRIALGRLATDTGDDDNNTPGHDDPPGHDGPLGGDDPPGGGPSSASGPGSGSGHGLSARRGGSSGNSAAGNPGAGDDAPDRQPPDTLSTPPSCATATRPPRLTDLILPLATLLGLADRPGEGHGLGVLDPALCRDLAATAVNSPRTELCVTVTDPSGIAIGHGCARPARSSRNRQARPGLPGQHHAPLTGLPARLNLTIASTRLARLAATLAAASRPGPHPAGTWAFTRNDATGPPGRAAPLAWYGSWTLTLPGGRELTVRLEPVPVLDCDHRYESHAYEPSDKLRHLVQVRDYACTFPPCSRHARESDFEHALPYDKGGRTCACNAGARSRKCHRVKQSPGWKVTQPRPGWHQWQTPSGRVYTQDPYRYPV